jgi:hypothetical protein
LNEKKREDMSQAAFPAGSIQAEGTLYADPKQINREGKNATVSLKTKLNYREQEGDELDSFFIDIIVTGSTAENIIAGGWKKYDRISFVGDFKGHRWDRKLEDGSVNQEQTITVFARQIGASPRFTEVAIEAQDYNGDGGGNSGGSNNDDSRSSRRGSSNNSNDDEPRSSRRSSRGSDDAEEPRSSRRSSRGSDNDSNDDSNSDEDSGSSRRSSRRARSTSYGSDD